MHSFSLLCCYGDHCGVGGGGEGVYGQPPVVLVVSALPLTASPVVRPSSVALIHVSSELREREGLLVHTAFSVVHFWLVSVVSSVFTHTHTHTRAHMHTHAHTHTHTHAHTHTHTHTNIP